MNAPQTVYIGVDVSKDSPYKEQLNGGFIGKSLTGICLRKTGASLDG